MLLLRQPRNNQNRGRGPGHNHIFLFLLLRLATILVFNDTAGNYAAATISCQPDGPDSDPTLGDALCATKYHTGSYCVPNPSAAAGDDELEKGSGTCSNPFLSGCLRNYLGEENFGKKRTCNSDDDEGAAERGECEASQFGYQEVRILGQNWEGPMFSAWIMQIVLSELLGVPATVETGFDVKGGSLYDPAIQLTYSSVTYDYDAISTARNNDGKCQQFQAERAKLNKPYKSCAHIITELWNGQQDNIVAAQAEGIIEPAIGNGGIGKYSWYAPYFTVKKDPSLLSYLGLVPADDLTNRRKLASIFYRPWTWKQFCEKISDDNCTSPYYDEEDRLISTRPPADISEAGRYFLSDSFHGHFAPTEENDCEKFPFNCTGHIANIQCVLSTFAVSQAFHLNIPVKSSGPGEAGGYSYGSMIEVYHASNYTKSDVLFHWWTPDPALVKFLGSDADLMRILLTKPTAQCKEARVTQEQRCAGDPGKKIGSCDSEAHSLQKAIVPNLRPRVDVDSAIRSPAYDAIKSVTISDLDQEQMFQKWLVRKTDHNYDARHSVCAWAADNLSILERWIPESYPRSIVDQKFNQAASYIALSVALIVLTNAGAVFAMTWKNRTKPVFTYAQVNILFMLLLGLALVCVGAILFAMVPTNGTCIARPWFVVIGSTLQIVPLIVKVAAINKIFRAARRLTSVRIKANHLYMIVGMITGSVMIYLLIWTLVDPMSVVSTHTLTKDIDDDGARVVNVTYSCASKSPYWLMFSFIYQFLLLVATTVLAFQNRKAKSEFNESMFLSLVIYSHFMFTLLRGIMYLLRASLEANVISTASSFLLSGDAMATLGIYFFPKLAKMNSVALARGPLLVGTGTGQRKRTTVSEIRERAAANNGKRATATPINALERPANGSTAKIASRRSTMVSFQSSALDDESHGGMDVERGPSQEEDSQRDEDVLIKSAAEKISYKISEDASVASPDFMEERVHESKNADGECRDISLGDLTAVSEAEVITESKEMFGQKLGQERGGTLNHIDHTERLNTSKISNMQPEMEVKSDSAREVAALYWKNRLLSKRMAMLQEENDELKLLLDAKQHDE